MSRTTAPANSRGRIGLCADAVDAIAAHVGIAQQVGFCVGESNLKDESSGPSMQQARQAASTVRSLPDGVLYTLCYLYQTTAARVRTGAWSARAHPRRITTRASILVAARPIISHATQARLRSAASLALLNVEAEHLGRGDGHAAVDAQSQGTRQGDPGGWSDLPN